MTNAIAKREGTELAHFGNRSQVRELAERIQMMLPGGENYTKPEALTLAQMAVAHGLDPFNGEIWLIKGKDGRVHGSLVGIKGLRKLAKHQSKFWIEFERATDPKEYGASENSIVHIAILKDKVNLDAWADAVRSFVDLGFDLDQAQKMAGKAPQTVGIGIWEPGDQTKMKPVQASMFRAEKDAIKRRFDVPFDVQVADLDDEPLNGDFDLDAEYTEVEVDEPRPADEVIEELGFEVEQPKDNSKRIWPAELIDLMVREKLANHQKHAVNILNLSPFVDELDLDFDEVLVWTRERND